MLCGEGKGLSVRASHQRLHIGIAADLSLRMQYSRRRNEDLFLARMIREQTVPPAKRLEFETGGAVRMSRNDDEECGCRRGFESCTTRRQFTSVQNRQVHDSYTWHLSHPGLYSCGVLVVK